MRLSLDFDNDVMEPHWSPLRYRIIAKSCTSSAVNLPLICHVVVEEQNSLVSIDQLKIFGSRFHFGTTRHPDDAPGRQVFSRSSDERASDSSIELPHTEGLKGHIGRQDVDSYSKSGQEQDGDR